MRWLSRFPRVALWCVLAAGSNAAADTSGPADRVQLGAKLFSDPRLSVDGKMSCATCHVPALGFVDGRPKAIGAHGAVGRRNTPTLLNATFTGPQFWDGRAATLEAQAGLPILDPTEMGRASPDDVVAAVARIPAYVADFRRVFGAPVNYEDLARALAAFERSQAATDSRFDRFVAGDHQALSAAEQRGFFLFQSKGRCGSCHAYTRAAPNFTDQDFHDIGITGGIDLNAEARALLSQANNGVRSDLSTLLTTPGLPELGRFLVSRRLKDVGAFRTPSLRNVAFSAPYMHDGSLATLWDVVDYYNRGGNRTPFLDRDMRPLGLSTVEVDDLVAFLGALSTARYAQLGAAALEEQRAIARTERLGQVRGSECRLPLDTGGACVSPPSDKDQSDKK